MNDRAPLRICLAVPHLAPYCQTNGIAWYNRWLAEGLARKGHIVTVIDVSLLERPSVTEPWHETIVMHPDRRSRLPRSLQRALFVREIVSRGDRTFDVFETSNWPGLAALLPRSGPKTFVRLITPSSAGLRNLVCNVLSAISVHRADATIGSTAYIRSFLSSFYRANLQNAYRISFGIPDVAKRSVQSPEGALTFLCIGRAEIRKGSDVLIGALLRAFRSGAAFIIVLVGSYDGFVRSSAATLQAWNELTSEFQNRITILADVPEDAKLDLLASSDYLLMTSRTESFGLPVIEAMRAGIAVISSTGGGLREVSGASPGNVLYEDPENAEQLANEITAAVSRGRADAQRRGLIARQTYLERFHEDVFLDATIEAYRGELQKSRGLT